MKEVKPRFGTIYINDYQEELLHQGFVTLSTNVNALIGENAALHKQMSFLEDQFNIVKAELFRVKKDLTKKRKK